MRITAPTSLGVQLLPQADGADTWAGVPWEDSGVDSGGYGDRLPGD